MSDANELELARLELCVEGMERAVYSQNLQPNNPEALQLAMNAYWDLVHRRDALLEARAK